MIYQTNGHIIEIYDGLDNLPITRHLMYNHALLLDSQIGGDVRSFAVHAKNAKSRMQKGDYAEAFTELDNMIQNMEFIIQKTNPKMRSFVVLIKKLDGKTITDEDLTDAGIDQIIKTLGRSGLTFSWMDNVLEYFKKKVDFEFDSFFPSIANPPEVKELYNQLQQRTILVLKTISDQSQSIIDQIQQIDDFIDKLMKPQSMHGHKGAEVQLIAHFENMCITLRNMNLLADPKSVSTLSFFRASMRAKEIIKSNKKQNRKNRRK